MIFAHGSPQRSPVEEREVSYAFLPEHWGHGYAREAVPAVIAWAFERLPAPYAMRVVAETGADNQRSRRLLEAIGLSPRAGGTSTESVIYAIERSARPGG
jgi:RimJ/RimL family protein N-acetyltransferase